VVFVNQMSQLAAAHVGQHAYVVFEYEGKHHFELDEELANLSDAFGKVECLRIDKEERCNINILSSSMSYAKAKLVVAPWQDINLDEVTIA